jgi:large subunit ribosomal protein L17
MHRHGYRGKKFGREAGPRRALVAGLADSLILKESIETTLPKAKETQRYTEKLVTKAKRGGLHNRRQIIAQLQTVGAANKLVDELAPKLQGRSSGYFTIERTSVRRGDGVQLARLKFIDNLKAAPRPKSSEKTASSAKKTAAPKKTNQPVQSKKTEAKK